MESLETNPEPTNKFANFFSGLLTSIGIEERKAKILLLFAIAVTLISSAISFLMMPPFGVHQDKIITIEKGDSLVEVSSLLKDGNIIRSRGLFELCIKIIGGEKPVVAGQYLFKEPISVCEVAFRISRNISGIPARKVTLPEGISNREMAVILAKNLPKFDAAFFLEHARPLEGYLFPDTYFFSENATAQGAESMMNATFMKKIESWKGEIESSKHSQKEIIIMASILEKEATTEEDKALVSGILWKRIARNLPLQVDAPFLYILNKKVTELTPEDFKIKSPYNTYRNKGLPAGPIGNPGIVAIRTAIHPVESPYLYYLSDADGVIHYAKTFEEHKSNIKKYLK